MRDLEQQVVDDKRPWQTSGEDPTARALAGVAHLPVDDPRRRAVRDRVVCEHLSWARRLAGRFAGRGEPAQDLLQVATIGLINAADRFDPTVGVSFVGFAGATVLGELRHHFRDRTWSLRVDRRMQELYLQVRRATEELTGQLRREPRDEEIAVRLGVSVHDVRDASRVALAYRAGSLNAPVHSDDEGGTELGDQLAVTDRDLESLPDRLSVRQLVRGLTVAEQRLLALRFDANLTQTQIAAQLGVSQMQVSRLLTAVLAKLRAALLSDG